MTRFLAALLTVALFGFAATPAAAQQTFIVATCGTLPAAFGAGNSGRPLVIDVNGQLCTNATITPSGTQNINLTQILGAAPSLTNPLWITPATGATFGLAAGTNAVGTVLLPTTGTIAAGNGVVAVPSSETAAGIAPVVSAALESNHVIKAGAGNFYSGYVTTGATAGWLLLANATSAPTAGGAAIAPLACVLAPANQTTSISGPGNIPMVFSTGITMVFSTSGCLTNTASTTAFFSGLAK